MSSDATEIYDYMYSNGIGCELSIFYENWAWMLESTGNSKRADAVLCEGIQRNAQPLEILLFAQRQLQLRVGSTMKQRLTDEAAAEECRSILSSLQPYGKKNIAPINRVGTNKLDMAVDPQKSVKVKTNTGKEAFKIYNDENSYVPSRLPYRNDSCTKVILNAERTKENDIKPKKWLNAKVHLKSTSISSKKTFEIYEDEESTNVIRKVPLITNALSTKMNWKNWKVPLALFEPDDPKKIPMYDKKKVYAGGEEFSFEEIRAAQWYKQEREKKQERERYEALQEEIHLLRDQFSSFQKIFCVNKLETELEKAAIDDARCSNENEKYSLSNIQGQKNYEAISAPETALQASHAVPEFEDHVDHSSTSNNSSIAACHTSTAEFQHSSLTGSPHMKEALSMLRGAWYQSTLDDGHATEDMTKVKDVNGQADKFTIYQDPTSTVNCLSSPVNKSVNFQSTENYNRTNAEQIHHGSGSDDDDIQNKPPEGYIQEKVTRPISGILQPSIGIPVEDQTNKNEEDDDDVLIIGDGNHARTFENVTVSVEKFVPNSHLASTPFQGTLNSVHLDGNTTADIEKTSMQSICSKYGTENNVTHQKVRGDLSTINEGSHEHCSSKSSSSSSAATHFEISTNHMQQLSSTPGIFVKKVASHKSEVNNIRKSGKESSEKTDEQHIIFPTDKDPFDINVTQDILSNLDISLSERPNYTEVNEVMPALRVPRMYQLGKEKYVLVQHHAHGGYAKVYAAEKESSKDRSNKRFALKVSKPVNKWEFYICSELWERLYQLDAKPDVRESLMFIEEAVFYKDGVILISKFGGYGTLIDIGNLYKKINQTMPECLVMCFALEMLHIIQKVHQCQIIHADVKPDNLLVINLDTFANSHVGNGNKSGVLQLIDFGRSIDMKQYPSGTAFTTVVNTSGFKCTEMLDGKPWTYQTDWFGVVGTIHMLLFAEYMKVQKNKEGYWEICDKFKRYWYVSFWQNLFHTLLNIPGCDKIPDVTPFIDELTEKIQQPSMVTDIRRKGPRLYDMWSENSKYSIFRK